MSIVIRWSQRRLVGAALIAAGVSLELTSLLNFPSSRNVDFSSNAQESLRLSSFVPLLSPNETDPWKRDLFGRLDRIRTICGDLCSINDRESFDARAIPVEKGTFAHRIEADMDCGSLVGAEDIDIGDTTVPYPPPPELMPYYTLNGMINFSNAKRYVNVYLGGQAKQNVWTKEDIDRDVDFASKGILGGTYGRPKTNEIIGQLRENAHLIANKSVLVIGSEKPWLESICVYLGAAKVTTLEYGAILSQHPQIKTLTPSHFRQAYQNGTLGEFDMVLSFSSLEHPGLGRYGDSLNPWGDILAIARAWCVTKPGGHLYLGVPTGPDGVQFNMHRIYGKVRWPLITTNWIQIDSGREDLVERAYKRGPGEGFFFQKVDKQ